MAFNMKAPPALEDDSYEAWKRDINIWSKFTDLVPEKQGLGVYLTLSGRARSAASEIPIEVLEKKDGLPKLIAKLDDLFLAEKGQRQFSAFNNLYNLRRSEEVSIDKFVADFEHIYYKFEQQDMKLPDPVLALMLLAACKLREDDCKLVMSAITTVAYTSIKSALKRIFSEKLGSTEASGVPCASVKSEPVMYGHGDYSDTCSEAPVMYARGGRRGRRPYRGGRGARSRPPLSGANRQPVSGGRRTNPLDSDGNISRCAVCDSKFHWARDCPDSHEQREAEQADSSEEAVHLSLFMGYTNAEKKTKIQSLVEESEGCAVLDTGCIKTVCGAAWYENYINKLSSFDQSKVVEKNSDSSFTFGDGSTVFSKKKATIPCYIGGRRSTITTDVVDCNIPLLLSNTSMRGAKMLLDFGRDAAVIGDSEIKLLPSKSGHYLLPISF